MSDLHDLCRLSSRPIDNEYIKKLREYLKSGIPATYTIEEAYNYTNNIEESPETTTTPLHVLCQHIPLDASEDETKVIEELVSTLFEYGAGWSFTDINNDTPGCILIKRGLKSTIIYDQIVDAGVRAELLLRKVNDNIEFIEVEEESDEEEETDLSPQAEEEVPKLVDTARDNSKEEEQLKEQDATLDPAEHQETYLNTKLLYTDGALVTTNKDGVMMSWEENLMQMGCDSMFKGIEEEDEETIVLNIGFGMGIIDTMIQEKKPTKHYICEPHPDVLAKLKADGWYEKSNVVVLEGRWQDRLPELLTEGIFFNGIYYDTYSEHYSDMLDLFDLIVGLLKPHGIFSFFNGLGADRQVIYEVYKKLVEIDLNTYGLQVNFEEVKVEDLKVWDDIKRSYWNCPIYYHPEAKFMDF